MGYWWLIHCLWWCNGQRMLQQGQWRMVVNHCEWRLLQMVNDGLMMDGWPTSVNSDKPSLSLWMLIIRCLSKDYDYQFTSSTVLFISDYGLVIIRITQDLLAAQQHGCWWIDRGRWTALASCQAPTGYIVVPPTSLTLLVVVDSWL